MTAPALASIPAVDCAAVVAVYMVDPRKAIARWPPIPIYRACLPPSHRPEAAGAASPRRTSSRHETATPYCLESDPNDKGDALGALANKLDLCRFSGPDVGQASGVFVDFDYRLIVRLGDQIPIFPAVGDALARVIDGGHLSTRDGASARR
jgi:hypothetical protein